MTKRMTVDAIADVFGGSSIDRNQRGDAGVPVFGLDQIAGRPSELPPRIPEGALPGRVTRLRSGDVVMALIGRTGRSAIVTPEHDGAVLDRECVAIRLHEPDGPVTPEWLHLWASSSDCRAQMDAQVTGQVIPRVPIRAARQLQVPVPDRNYQLQASQTLQDLEAAVNATRRTLAVLDQLQRIEVDLHVYHAALEEVR